MTSAIDTQNLHATWLSGKCMIEMSNGSHKRASQVQQGDIVQSEWTVSKVTNITTKSDKFLFSLDKNDTMIINGIVTKLV